MNIFVRTFLCRLAKGVEEIKSQVPNVFVGDF